MAHDEAPTPKQNVVTLQFINFSQTAPPVLVGVSGSLFISGGELNYLGSNGTQTILAVS